MQGLKARWLLLLETLCVLGFCVGCDALLFHYWIARLYPTGDEFSLIAQSQFAPWHWFAEGYSKYFIVYPEYTVPYANFIRPVANLVFRIFSNFHSGYKLQLIAANYGVHGAIVCTLYAAAILLKKSRVAALSLALAAFLTPAFWASPMPLLPSFALDGIAAFFVLAAMLALAVRRDWLCVACLMLAVFTKETALPVACALMVYSLVSRKKLLFAGLLAALLAWAGVRLLAFGTTSGVYEMSGSALSAKFVILRMVGLLFIPVSFMTRDAIKAAIQDRNVLALGTIALYLAGNVGAWVLALVAFRSKTQWLPNCGGGPRLLYTTTYALSNCRVEHGIFGAFPDSDDRGRCALHLRSLRLSADNHACY
jgi:hypothetical protein